MNIYRYEQDYSGKGLYHPIMKLSRVSWNIRSDYDHRCLEAKIDMTPKGGFDIEYPRVEPAYISKLREVLSDTDVTLRAVKNPDCRLSDNFFE